MEFRQVMRGHFLFQQVGKLFQLVIFRFQERNLHGGMLGDDLEQRFFLFIRKAASLECQRGFYIVEKLPRFFDFLFQLLAELLERRVRIKQNCYAVFCAFEYYIVFLIHTFPLL